MRRPGRPGKSEGIRREPVADRRRPNDMPHHALTQVSRRVGLLALASALATLTVAGCAQGPGATSPAGVAPTTSAPSATAVPGPTEPAPRTTGPSTGSIVTPPPRAGSGADAVPPSSTVLVASLTAQTLGVVTDRDIYGPVTVTNAGRVAQVAHLINNAPPRVAAIARCPMEGTGNLTIVFESSASGPPAATVIISTSGCPGITVRPAAGGVIGLDGGADTVKQIESILDLPWPKPAG